MKLGQLLEQIENLRGVYPNIDEYEVNIILDTEQSYVYDLDENLLGEPFDSGVLDIDKDVYIIKHENLDLRVERDLHGIINITNRPTELRKDLVLEYKKSLKKKR